MIETYYAYGTTLANMVNIETVTDDPPFTNADNAVPLTGSVGTRTGSGKWRWDGAINSELRFSMLRRDKYRALAVAMFGAPTVSSAQLYFTLLDEHGYYSPFLFNVDKPQVIGETVNGAQVVDVVIPLYGGVLQSTTRTTTYTMTASDRLVYADTTSGNFTITLPAANAVQGNTVVAVEKIVGANTLTIQRAGADTVNGGTSVTLTANRSRFDLVSDGTNAWVTLPYP